MVLGDRIKALRERRDWSQTLLAKKIGISKSVMSRIESGTRPLEDSLLVKLADILEVSSDYLLGIEKKESGIEPTKLEGYAKQMADLVRSVKSEEKAKKLLDFAEEFFGK